MEKLRRKRDNIISKHAKRIEGIETNVLDLVKNTTSKSDNMNVKGSATISGIVKAMLGIQRRKISPMSGKEILNNERRLLEHAEKVRDTIGSEPAYKIQLDDLNAEIERYKIQLHRIDDELSKMTEEGKKKLLEEKYTLIESKR